MLSGLDVGAKADADLDQKIQVFNEKLTSIDTQHFIISTRKNADLVPKLVNVIKEMEQEGLIAEIRSQYIVRYPVISSTSFLI